MAQHERSDALPRALVDYFDARTAAFLRARRQLDIGELDARALLFVAEHPGTRPRDLAEYLGVTSPSVTLLADRLVKREAIRRDVSPDDRRGVALTAIVDLTREPWSALKRFDDAIAHVASSLDDGEAVRLGRLLSDITEEAAAKSL